MNYRDFIDSLGGSARLAERLGWTGANARINNWCRRGVPQRVLVEHAWLLKELKAFKKKTGAQVK